MKTIPRHHRTYPKCEDVNAQDIDLMAVILFGGTEEEIAAEIGVPLARFRRWARGTETTPAWAYRLLRFLRGHELPPSWGEWAGIRRVKDRLVPPGYEFPEGVTLRDVRDMRFYRLCTSEVAGQAEVIKRLTKERNFYRSQCALEARSGMVLNQVFQFR